MEPCNCNICTMRSEVDQLLRLIETLSQHVEEISARLAILQVLYPPKDTEPTSTGTLHPPHTTGI